MPDNFHDRKSLHFKMDSIDKDDEARLFYEGIRLFNAGEWFDAHEVWEENWRLASGQRKYFYQGLVQCAVVLEHVRRGNPRGVRSVWQTAVKKFDGLPDVFMGINVRELLAQMRQTIKPVLSLPVEEFDPSRPRGQTLPFDSNTAPQIVLESDPFV